ncbi:MAG: hypothetical protein AAGI28_08070 [Pseudomonadota bacterium]
MLKSNFHKLAPVMAAALLVIGSPAAALSGAEEAAFEAEIGEARSKMMSHSAAALKHARNATQIARGENTKAQKARLTARWLEAEALMRLNRANEASPIIKSALRETSASFEGSKLHADLLRSHGSLQARAGAFAEALSNFTDAEKLYQDIGEDRSRAIVLLSIGSLYSGARDFEKALGHFTAAAQAFPNDPALSLSIHNNSGNALKGLGRYSDAEREFTSALSTQKAKSSPILKARILTNIASTQVMDRRTVEAEATAQEAMAIAQEHAPGWARFIDGVLAQIELRKGNLDIAQAYIERAFDGEDLATTASHFREFHETAVVIYERAGRSAHTESHQAALERLDSQIAKLDA